MFGLITTCASCGAELEVPCDPRDPDADGWRGHCDRCNQRFDDAMRAEYPYGQCATCGGRYDPVDVECERCEGEGELVILDGDGYQYAACGKCGGAGSTVQLIALHEETLCGFPHGEPRYWDRPTHVAIVAALREARDHFARLDEAAAWRANLANFTGTLGAAADVDAAIDDLPF